MAAVAALNLVGRQLAQLLYFIIPTLADSFVAFGKAESTSKYIFLVHLELLHLPMEIGKSNTVDQ
jgi:hypothetical protein